MAGEEGETKTRNDKIKILLIYYILSIHSYHCVILFIRDPPERVRGQAFVGANEGTTPPYVSVSSQKKPAMITMSSNIISHLHHHLQNRPYKQAMINKNTT
jgi:hypothetical protein